VCLLVAFRDTKCTTPRQDSRPAGSGAHFVSASCQSEAASPPPDELPEPLPDELPELLPDELPELLPDELPPSPPLHDVVSPAVHLEVLTAEQAI